MNQTDEQNDKAVRLARIREIVREDFARVQAASSPYQVLNVMDGEGMDEIEERYVRYERFYRAENFQRLGDIDLTRKALDIRRAIGRSIVDIRKRGARARHPLTSSGVHDAAIFDGGEDRYALAEIYLRDGMAYLQLGEMNEAQRFLRLSVDYDPEGAMAMAYLGYVVHKQRSFDQEAVEEARRLLDRAAEISPHEPDIFVLRGRFFAKLEDTESLQATIDAIEKIDPAHHMLDRLQRKLNRLKE